VWIQSNRQRFVCHCSKPSVAAKRASWPSRPQWRSSQSYCCSTSSSWDYHHNKSPDKRSKCIKARYHRNDRSREAIVKDIYHRSQLPQSGQSTKEHLQGSASKGLIHIWIACQNMLDWTQNAFGSQKMSKTFPTFSIEIPKPNGFNAFSYLLC